MSVEAYSEFALALRTIGEGVWLFTSCLVLGLIFVSIWMWRGTSWTSRQRGRLAFVLIFVVMGLTSFGHAVRTVLGAASRHMHDLTLAIIYDSPVRSVSTDLGSGVYQSWLLGAGISAVFFAIGLIALVRWSYRWKVESLQSAMGQEQT